jgi:hypothetical protein
LAAFLHPQNVSKINLGNAPHVLVAASHGDVDIVAGENVHILPEGDFHGLSENAFITAHDKVRIQKILLKIVYDWTTEHLIVHFTRIRLSM